MGDLIFEERDRPMTANDKQVRTSQTPVHLHVAAALRSGSQAVDFQEPSLDEEFAGRMAAADRAAREEDQASQTGPYAFLSEHSRVDVDGTLSTTCRTDGEPWPCTVTRALFAGRRSGYLLAAGRLEQEADERDDRGSTARRAAARLRVDAEEIDDELRRSQP